MKLKPVQVTNYAFGTVRIVDPMTRGEVASNMPMVTDSVAWHIYGFSKAPKRDAEEPETDLCIYLPGYALLFNGTYIPVEPLRGNRGNSDFYNITEFRGDLMCSVYKDIFNIIRAKLTIGPMQNAIYSFVICSINGTDKGASVTQYVSGTLSLSYGGKPFDPKIAIKGLPLAGGEDEDDSEEASSVITGFSNCYWMNGGMLQYMEDQDTPGDDGFIALRAGATASNSGTASLIIRESLAALQEEMRNPEYFVMPLYKVEGGVITVDFRSMPQAQMAEIL